MLKAIHGSGAKMVSPSDNISACVCCRFKATYGPVDKRVSTIYRERLVKCYGIKYDNFNVSLDSFISVLSLDSHLQYTPGQVRWDQVQQF